MALALIAHCHPATTPTIAPTAEPGPTATAGPPPPAPPPAANPFLRFAGTYNIHATKTQDPGCNFFPSFDGRIVIVVKDSAGNIRVSVIERRTRDYDGTITLGQVALINASAPRVA